MADVATYDIVVRGGESGAAQFDRVTKSAAKLNDTSKSGAKIFADHGDALGKVGGLIGNVSPKFAQLANVVDDAGKAVMALTSGIGLGPAGLIAGGVLGALALWVTSNEEAEKSIDKVAQAAERARFAAMNFEAQLQKVTGARDKAGLKSRLESGAASSAEYEAEIARLEAFKQNLLRGQAEGSFSAAGVIARQYPAEEKLAQMRASLEEARRREEIEKAIRDGGNKTGAIGESIPDAKAGAAAKNDDYFFDAVKRREATDAQLAELQRQSIQAELAEEQRASDDRLRIAQAGIDAEYEASKAASEARIAQRELEHEEYERMEQQAANNSELRRKLAQEALNVFGNNMSTAMSKVAKGQKLATGAMIEGIGDQAIQSGIFHMLEGGAKLAGMNPAGAAEMAAGGALLAFGMGLANAGSHMSGGSNAGSGSAAARPSAMSRPAEPTRSMDTQPQTKTSTIIVQVDPITGEAIMREMEGTARISGRRLSPHVIGSA